MIWKLLILSPTPNLNIIMLLLCTEDFGVDITDHLLITILRKIKSLIKLWRECMFGKNFCRLWYFSVKNDNAAPYSDATYRPVACYVVCYNSHLLLKNNITPNWSTIIHVHLYIIFLLLKYFFCMACQKTLILQMFQ